MKIKGIIDIDLVNYKKACMTIMMPYCSFKCGSEYCQNNELAAAPIVDIADDKIIQLYINNPVTEAVCFQGLEPFDSVEEIFNFIRLFREINLIYDDIVIYTGYTKDELEEKGYLTKLKDFGKINNEGNIIIKYGRFIPNCEAHYDKILGVNLASENQYAERIC